MPGTVFLGYSYTSIFKTYLYARNFSNVCENMKSLNLHNNPMKWDLYFHFTDGKTETPQGQMTHQSHRTTVRARVKPSSQVQSACWEPIGDDVYHAGRGACLKGEALSSLVIEISRTLLRQAESLLAWTSYATLLNLPWLQVESPVVCG